MSTAALEVKKQQVEDYFSYHPDSQEIQIVGSSAIFPGLFDYSYAESGTRDGGNVSQMTKKPTVTFYAGYLSLITAGVTNVIIGTITYKVLKVRCDKNGSYQGVLWLQEV
jgi:hypothetical protein